MLYERLDDPRARIAQEINSKLGIFLFFGLVLGGAPWGFYVAAAVYHINPFDNVPATEITTPLLIASIILTFPAIYLFWLAIVRQLPLVQRGVQTPGWIEKVESAWLQHHSNVTFRYSIEGSDYRICRMRVNSEAIRYDQNKQVVVTYDPQRPSRSDVVVLFEQDGPVDKMKAGLRLGFAEARQRLIVGVVGLVNILAIAGLWKLARASDTIENMFIPPMLFAAVGFTWMELIWWQKRTGRKNGTEFVLNWSAKLMLTLLWAGVIVWIAYGVVKVRSGA